MPSERNKRGGGTVDEEYVFFLPSVQRKGSDLDGRKEEDENESEATRGQ